MFSVRLVCGEIYDLHVTAKAPLVRIGGHTEASVCQIATRKLIVSDTITEMVKGLSLARVSDTMYETCTAQPPPSPAPPKHCSHLSAKCVPETPTVYPRASCEAVFWTFFT